MFSSSCPYLALFFLILLSYWWNCFDCFVCTTWSTDWTHHYNSRTNILIHWAEPILCEVHLTFLTFSSVNEVEKNKKIKRATAVSLFSFNDVIRTFIFNRSSKGKKAQKMSYRFLTDFFVSGFRLLDSLYCNDTGHDTDHDDCQQLELLRPPFQIFP